MYFFSFHVSLLEAYLKSEKRFFTCLWVEQRTIVLRSTLFFSLLEIYEAYIAFFIERKK